MWLRSHCYPEWLINDFRCCFGIGYYGAMVSLVIAGKIPWRLLCHLSVGVYGFLGGCYVHSGGCSGVSVVLGVAYVATNFINMKCSPVAIQEPTFHSKNTILIPILIVILNSQWCHTGGETEAQCS